MKVEIKPHWWRNFQAGTLEYYRRQFVDEKDMYDTKKGPQPDIVISRMAYHDLLDWIKENEKGIIKTDRTEDLKIIHRLLDVLETRT